MDELHVYFISDDYVRYLYGFDSRVPYNKDGKRPYVGVVLRVGDYQYFVPMESPKPSHQGLKSRPHILKLQGGALGILGFNNMIPVPDRALTLCDISAIENRKYRFLLENQQAECNHMDGLIHQRAQATYSSVLSGKNAFLLKISCDFRKLEEACKEYR